MFQFSLFIFYFCSSFTLYANYLLINFCLFIFLIILLTSYFNKQTINIIDIVVRLRSNLCIHLHFVLKSFLLLVLCPQSLFYVATLGHNQFSVSLSVKFAQEPHVARTFPHFLCLYAQNLWKSPPFPASLCPIICLNIEEGRKENYQNFYFSPSLCSCNWPR